MKNCNANKRGFTLIELLVVVLIIGILAAVALPQYQKAVEKSRITSLFPLLKALAQAKIVYHLEHEEYARRFEDLSVTLPPEFIITESSWYGQIAYKGTDSILLDPKESHEVALNTYLSDGSVLSYYVTTMGEPYRATCVGVANKRSASFCKALPEAQYQYQYEENEVYYIY